MWLALSARNPQSWWQISLIQGVGGAITCSRCDGYRAALIYCRQESKRSTTTYIPLSNAGIRPRGNAPLFIYRLGGERPLRTATSAPVTAGLELADFVSSARALRIAPFIECLGAEIHHRQPSIAVVLRPSLQPRRRHQSCEFSRAWPSRDARWGDAWRCRSP
jgi:hypothetical protein